jgi:glutathione synthase/RimK-type ligase-like ATP-grasp enzyme
MPAAINQIAILTPDPDDRTYADAWPAVLDRLATALATAGVDATPLPWTGQVDDCSALMEFPLVLPLLVWGYHLDHARWLRACTAWEEAGVPMANPPAVLARNSDKRYLAGLAAQGVAIPPTTWSDRITRSQLEAMFESTGADRLIVKPTVSGGAWRTRSLRREDASGDLPEGDMMIQPYLPTIETEGETSLLFFGGRLSHVVNKRPVAGDFRIQLQYGGRYTAVPVAPPGALALATQVLAAIDSPLLYARIDVVPGRDGRWLLMEAELIEPDFYLDHDPVAGAGFAQSVRELLRS